MKTTHAMAATAIAATAFLSGCASPDQRSINGPSTSSYPASSTYPAPAPTYASYYGVVDSIQTTPASGSTGIGVGAVIGGVAGGLLGNQVGGGNGRTAATVVGAVGGAVIGNQIEQRNRVQTPATYQISVRTDNGGYQTISQDSLADLRVGDRARIENGRVYRY